MHQRSTNITLIIFTLVAGAALGWFGRDVLVAPSVPVVSRPSAGAAPTVHPISTARPTPTLPPTADVAPTVPAPTSTSIPATPLLTAQPEPTPAPLPTLLPATALLPSPAPATENGQLPPANQQPTTYIGHTVVEGETLAALAVAAGSTSELIAQYNVLVGEPQPGRALIIPQLTPATATLQGVPQLVRRGRSDKPWVALTLDAGAGAEPVAAMLQTLRERNIKLTFFLTGTWIRANPELTRQIVADGHEIANHTLTHPDLRHISSAAMRDELAATEALLVETAGAGATTKPFFRPPYGAYDERVLNVAEAEGYLPIYWTLDSLDSVGAPKTAAFLLDRVTNKLSPEQLRGAIILAHCGSAPTAEALPQILDRFAAMGFEVRKLSDVL